MTNLEALRKLKSVNLALQEVEVKGRQNMDILLGSMQAIDQIIPVFEKEIMETKQCQPEIEIEAVPETK